MLFLGQFTLLGRDRYGRVAADDSVGVRFFTLVGAAEMQLVEGCAVGEHHSGLFCIKDDGWAIA